MSLLLTLAEFSHIFSIGSILICATLMFLFLVRLLRQDLLEGGGGVVRVGTDTPPPSKVGVARIEIPIHIRLIHADLSNGIEIEVVGAEGSEGELVRKSCI